VRSTSLYRAIVVGAAVILMSACSSMPQSNTIGLPSTSVAPNLLGPNERAYFTTHGVKLATGRVLFVSTSGDRTQPIGKLEALQYGTWVNLGTISNGIKGPLGNWADKEGNLYVADGNGADVTEYNVLSNLIFTYSADMVTPTVVTTDRFGAVYEGDGAASVHEYAQQNNSPAATCVISGTTSDIVVFGVALDRHGDVFVSYESGLTGYIIEYKHGLIDSDCEGTVLPITLNEAGGIAVDKQGNLVVCDSAAPAVDIIAPPYTSITGTLGSGWARPVNVSIDKAGTQAYVSDIAAGVVQVLTYPGGSILASLGRANGLFDPVAAVDSENYVP
jgi:hypothetical protein